MNKKARPVSFDRVADVYDETRVIPDSVIRKAFSIIHERINLRENQVILDAGIGTGRTCGPLSEYDVELIGIDISPKMLGKCRERIRSKISVDKFRLIQGDAIYLPFKDSTFDVIISMHVFPFIRRWKEAIKEIKRTLKPRGFLIDMKYRNPVRESIVAKKYKELHGKYSENLLISICKRIYRKVVRVKRRETWFSYIKKSSASVQTKHIVWTQRVRTSKVLDSLEKRVYSDYWSTPDKTHSRIMAELEKWMKKENISDFEKVECKFEIIIINFMKTKNVIRGGI